MKINKFSVIVSIVCLMLSCGFVIGGLKMIDLCRVLHRNEVHSAVLCLSIIYDVRSEEVSDKVKNSQMVFMLGCLDRLESVCAYDDRYVASFLRNRSYRDVVCYAIEITSQSNALFMVNTVGSPLRRPMNYPRLQNLLQNASIDGQVRRASSAGLNE